jgi:hypothetical protein
MSDRIRKTSASTRDGGAVVSTRVIMNGTVAAKALSVEFSSLATPAGILHHLEITL